MEETDDLIENAAVMGFAADGAGALVNGCSGLGGSVGLVGCVLAGGGDDFAGLDRLAADGADLVAGVAVLGGGGGLFATQLGLMFAGGGHDERFRFKDLAADRALRCCYGIAVFDAGSGFCFDFVVARGVLAGGFDHGALSLNGVAVFAFLMLHAIITAIGILINHPFPNVCAGNPDTPCDQETIKTKTSELNVALPNYKQIANVKFRETESPKTTTKKIKRNVTEA